MRTTKIFLTFAILMAATVSKAQTVRGTVTDATTSEELIGAAVRVVGTEKGTITDVTGQFEVTGLKPGRYDIEVSYLGYDPSVTKDVLVAGTKDVQIDVKLVEAVANQLGEVVVRPRVNKIEAVNPLSLVGGKMLSMEEANRYAGGFNDPARIVSSFAGIGGTSDNNGISVHGNTPASMQWRLEGVEIYSPNHFAEVLESGSGVIGAINANIMANSDFYSSAYGAEYSNAYSGVFDIKLRKGNNTKYEHSAQVGTMGAELMSEGPFSKNGRGSYIVNYRYGLTSIAGDLGLIDLEGERVKYQDMNFNLHMPTKSAGTFNIFGIGMLDRTSVEDPANLNEWESLDDAMTADTKNALAIIGTKHLLHLPHNWTWQTTAVFNYNLIQGDNGYYPFDFTNHVLTNGKNSVEFDHMKQENQQMSLTTNFSRQLSPKFYTKFGGSYTHNFYHLKYSASDFVYQPETMTTLINEDGNTGLANLYTSNSWKPNGYLTVNFGVAGNYFLLAEELSVEPRLQLMWKPDKRNTFSAGYGLNSRMDKLDIYFSTNNSTAFKGDGKDMGLEKNHQTTVAWNHQFSDYINLRLEGFFQYGFNIPVSADPNGTYCIVNRLDYILDEPLVGKGNTRNYGIDATLEHYMKNGFYATLNGSLYKMEYRAQDKVWRHARLDRGYLVKLLGGKEWMLGNKGKNVFNISAKATYMGGIRHTPIDIAATEAAYTGANIPSEVIYDEKNAFSEQYDPMLVIDLTVSYKIVCRKMSHTIAFHAINLLDEKTPNYDTYNFVKHKIDTWQSTAAFPNFYYRIDF